MFKMDKATSLVWVVNIPMRAVRDHLGIPLGGSGFWLDALACELTRGRKVRLTVVSCSPAYRLDSSFIRDGVKYVQLTTSYMWFMPLTRMRALRRIERAIRAEQPALVDFHGTEFGWGEVADRIDAPSITTLQGLISEVGEFSFGPNGKIAFFRDILRAPGRLRHISREILAFVSLGPRIRAELRQIRASRYFLGRTAYDRAHAERLQPRLLGYYAAARVLRQTFYVTEWDPRAHDNKIVFNCGRLTPSKGVDLLIRSLPIVAARVPNVRLRIGGSRRPTEGWGVHLVRLAERLGVADRVEFCGYLNEQGVAAELEKASVFALPSYNENSPNTLAEAMIVGVPCVSAQVGGVTSMLEHERNGLLFPRGDVRELAAHLIQLLSRRDYAITIGAAGRRDALLRHDPSRVAEATVVAYNAILQAVGSSERIGPKGNE